MYRTDTTALKQAPSASRHFEVNLLDQDSPGRDVLEDFVADRYERHFNAQLNEFFPTIVSVTDQETGQRIAALGIRLARISTLFSEAYLDEPVEAVIARHFKGPVDRGQVVEFGNFVTLAPGYNRIIIPVMARLIEQLPVQWALYTLTRAMQNSFRRLGVDLHKLADACPDRLSEKGASWGSYYDKKPSVWVTPLTDSLNQIMAGQASSMAVNFNPDAMTWFTRQISGASS